MGLQKEEACVLLARNIPQLLRRVIPALHTHQIIGKSNTRKDDGVMKPNNKWDTPQSGGKKGVCFAFQNGYCRRSAAECRYQHIAKGQTPTGGNTTTGGSTNDWKANGWRQQGQQAQWQPPSGAGSSQPSQPLAPLPTVPAPVALPTQQATQAVVLATQQETT